MNFTLIKPLIHHFVTRQNIKLVNPENIIFIFILLGGFNIVLFSAHKSFKSRLEKHFTKNRYWISAVLVILVKNCPKSKFHKVLLSM